MKEIIDTGIHASGIKADTLMIFTKEEKKMMLELIGNEQIHMIIKDHEKYESEKYKSLEELKVKIKDM